MKNIAFLTSGGIAPCLSSCIVRLMFQYKKKFDNVNFVGYLNGYKGLLTNNKIFLKPPDTNKSDGIYEFGGSLIGNSRVKLTNVNDCINKGYIKKNEIPLKIAAEQLKKDKIDILHTIGGDDTNTTACDLSNFLKKNHYKLTVIGLPKTIDNDVIPINQTLGAITAAEQTAIFFENIVNENTTSSRHLIIHEVMGRNCGWLTAKSAHIYKQRLKNKKFFETVNLRRKAWDIHSVLIPEIEFNIEQESLRLKRIMDFEYQFFKMGGVLTAGVDAGRHILPGFGDQRNFELLKEGGFSTEEALKVMTSNGAKVLSNTEIGAIEIGKKADLIVIEENPLENLKVLYGTGAIKLNNDNEVERVGGIKFTIKDGIIYDSKLLLEDVKKMVRKSKDELNYEIYQPGNKMNIISKKAEILD